MGESLRIGVVTPIPTPYRDAFWNAVADVPGTMLRVYYCASINADRPWNPSWEMRYESEVLPGFNVMAPFPSQGFSYWNPGIGRRLRAGNLDALVVGGYSTPSMMSAILFAKRRRLPYFLMSESHLREPRAAWRQVVKDPIVRWAVGGAAGSFPTGTWARDYLLHYGARPDRLWFLPNVPDVAWLDARALELADRRTALCRTHDLGTGPVILFVGRLVPFKRVDLLLEAFANANLPSSTRLAIVGDGVERDRLRDLAGRLGLLERVRFVGFVEPAEIPSWYAVADLVVLPSVGETWSVAVIEALASGLPVVTTDTVGAAAEVINGEAVGAIVAGGDARALAAALSKRLATPTDRGKVREAWKPILDRLRYETQASGFVDAIREGIGRGPCLPRVTGTSPAS